MATDPSKITILVKKADGTFERKTLDEVQKMKASNGAPVSSSTPRLANKAPQAAPVPRPVNPASSKPAAAAPAKLPPPPPPAKPAMPVPAPQPKPVNWLEKNKAPASAAKPMGKTDATSLLEEPAPALSQETYTSPSRDGQVEEIMKKIPFSMNGTVANRLRTLVQLRLKDIRTTDQTREAMLRPEKEGGVGLSLEQANLVLSKLPGGAPLASEKNLPATTTPNNPFRHGETPKPKPTLPQSATPAPTSIPAAKQAVIETFTKTTAAEAPLFKLTTEGRAKPILQDVTAQPLTMGPTDEIKMLSLTDFRRLSSNPEEAAMRLKQKFVNLKDESILLYLEALTVWKLSPLYQDYMAATIEALVKKRALSTLAEPQKVKYEEMKAIIGMEKQLDYF